jgi:arylsulfatase A-like enzyme
MKKAIPLLLSLAAAFFVASCIHEIWRCGWITLAKDQWRIYDQYFSLPFPDNILQLQNGHRPILPGLVFLIDIQLFKAQNVFLLVTGVALNALAALLISLVIWADKGLAGTVRLSCIAFSWMIAFWLGNDRVLLHGNESVHCYLAIVAFLLAVKTLISATDRCNRIGARGATSVFLLLSLWCLAASASFGFGMIAWPAVILIAVVLRLPARIPVGLLVLFLVTVTLYCFVLPGDGRVQKMLSFEPLENIRDASYWLGSLAGRLLKPIAGKTLRAEIISPVVGGAGILCAVFILLKKVRRPPKPAPCETLALSLIAFGLGCALLAAIGRNSHFDVLPSERLAPRYLPWVILFWLGQIFYFSRFASRAGAVSRLPSWIRAVPVLSILVLMTLSQTSERGPRTAQRRAALGLVAGVRDDAAVRAALFKNRTTVYRTAGVLRERQLAMFSWPVGKALGRAFPGSYEVRRDLPLRAVFEPITLFCDRGRDSARFEGKVFYDGTCRPDYIVVADGGGHIRGLGILDERESVSDGKAALKRVFFGYIDRFLEGEDYRFSFILDDGKRAAAVPAPGVPVRRETASGPVRVKRVFLVTLDTLRADHVSCYGYPRKTTPFLDGLAREGVLCRNALCQMSTTSPSHASILTSLHPCQHGVLKNGHRLDDFHTTLAELLRDKGFVTAAAVSTNRHFEVSNLHQGFDFFDEPHRAREKALDRKYRPAEETVDAAIDSLERNAGRGRLFFWLHLYDPHRPYERHKRIRDDLEEQLGGEAFVRFLTDTHRADPAVFGSPAKMAEFVSRYDEEIRYSDSQVERFFSFIEDTGLGDDSLWIVTADHGEGLGNHGWLDHGKHIYNEQLSVPLVFYTPDGWIRPKEIVPLVELLDLFPTVAEAVIGPEWKKEFPLMGHSLLSRLRDAGDLSLPIHEFVLAQRRSFRPSSAGTIRFEPGSTFAIQDRRFKYLHRTEGEDEFFVLDGDPYEETNRILELVREAALYRKLLEEGFAELTAGSVGKTQEIDEEARARLEELGYAR